LLNFDYLATLLNLRSGDVQPIQHNMIKFVSVLRQVGGFLRVLRFLPPIKLTIAIWLKYYWKWRYTL